MDERSPEEVAADVSKYSVLVGFLLIIVFVVPCVVFALIAKKFQSQPAARKPSTVSRLFIGTMFADGQGEDGLAYQLPDTDSSGYGAFGQIEISPFNLECIEKIVFMKSSLACIDTWKAYAPPQMNNGDSSHKKLIAVRKLGPVALSNDRDGAGHSWCLRAELFSVSRVPQHHSMLNLLGVCSVPGGNPHALLYEYPLYGSLHSYLICKRRGRISNSNAPWAGLERLVPEDQLLMGLPESTRSSISLYVDDFIIRSRPFQLRLNERFSVIDELVLGLQIVCGMEFLVDNGILHKRLSTENVMIVSGFHLKLTGMDYDVPVVHRGGTVNRLRRSPSGRNLLKWDAPEVIEIHQHSEKSEVWRFGMTFWETCSLGDTPFPEIPNRALMELLKKGQKPQIPDGCEKNVFCIMEDCWNLNSERRPTFEEIAGRMRELLKTQEAANSATSTPQLSSRTTPTHGETYSGYWTPPGNSNSSHAYRPRPTATKLVQRANKQLNGTTSPATISPVPSPECVPGYEETDV